MLKVLHIVIIVMGFCLLWAFFSHTQLLLACVNFLVMPVIGLIYFSLRGWKLNKIDKLMLFIFIISAIGDTLTVFQKKNFLNNAPIIITFITHIVYMSIFRMQGAFVFVKTSKDYFKLLIPSFIIFIGFGTFLNSAPSSIFFFLMLFAVQEAILVVLAFFREVDKNSFYLGIYGSIFMVLSDFLYAFCFFKYNKPSIYLSMAIINILAQYLLSLGISTSNGKEGDKSKIHISDRVLVFIKTELKSIKFYFRKNIKNNLILQK